MRNIDLFCSTLLKDSHEKLAFSYTKKMLLSLLRSSQLGPTWRPLNFSSLNFVRISANWEVEETIPGYIASRYYPARIGEIIKERYQVVGKLGFGASSTVWLARDMK